MPGSLDSKDFLDQLRSVHFTLLAVCLAVLVIITSPGPTWVDKASGQLNRIVSITDKGNWKPVLWAETSAAEVSAGHRECTDTTDSRPNTLYMTWGQSKFKVVVVHRWDLHYEVPEQALETGSTALLPDRPNGYIRPLLTSTPPDTLSKFKAIWDSSGELWCPIDGIPVLSSGQVFLWDPTFDKFTLPGGIQVPFESYEPSRPENLEEKDFVWVMTKNLKRGAADDGMTERPPVALIQVNDTSKARYQWSIATSVIPKDFSDHKFTVRSQIIKTFRDLPDMAFSDAFPELDQFAGGQRAFDSSFEYLRKSLDSQLTSAKETFEVFGIKFPMEATTRWGVVLIILLQGYFWLHLDEYRRRGFKNADVAWIGIYTSRAAITVSALSMFVPVSVIVLLCVRQGGQGLLPVKASLSIVLSSLVCILSASVAGLTAYSLWLVHRVSEKPS
jgi:hypothetical protein